jgi:hypothetical protein
MTSMGLVSLQAAVQAWLKPAMWVPGVRSFHSEQHEWRVAAPAGQVLEAVLAAAGELSRRGWSQYEVDKAGRRVVLNYLTKVACWLDQVELRFEEAGPSSTVVRVHAYSTGMLPLLIPLAPLLNILLIFFPFLDKDGKCGAEINELKAAVAGKVKQLESRVVVYSLGNPARRSAGKQLSAGPESESSRPKAA